MDSGREKLTSLFEKVCNECGDKTAVKYLLDNGEEKLFSFNAIQQAVKELTNNLVLCGLRPGDRAAILSTLSPYCYITYFAFVYAGLTAVVIDPQLPETEKDRLLANADIRGVVASASQYETYAKRFETITPVLNIESGQEFDENISRPAMESTPDPDMDAAAILYSSGTTSQAKGVVIGFEGQLKAIHIDLEFVGTNNIQWLEVYPFFHISGLSSFLAIMLNGAEIGLLDNMTAVKLQQSFQIYRPNTFAMVPKVYEVFEAKIREAIHSKGQAIEAVLFLLMRFCGFIRKHLHINFGKILFKSINKQVFGGRMIFLGVGGGLSNPKNILFFLNLGYVWFNMYASTEANVPMTSTTWQDNFPVGSSGRVDRFPNIHIKIDNPDTSGIGEILIKSDLMMKGYFREPELTAAAFENGYFKTGDLGYINRKNELVIMGRAKESIFLHTGEKVSPEDIEAIYSEVFNSSVAFSCCGVPDEDGYDTAHLFVEKGNLSVSDMEKIKKRVFDFSSGIKSNYTVSSVHFIERLPMTSIGKVKRFELQKLALAEQKINIPEAAPNMSDSTENIILHIVTSLADGQTVTPESHLKYDLGLDSLTLFEMCVEIESALDMTIAENMDAVETVQDLIDLVSGGAETHTAPYNIEDYPLPKTKGHIRALKRYMRLSRLFWKFDISGLENIPVSGNYILCPNHQSYLDSLWIWAAIGHKRLDLQKICCLAAEVFLPSKSTLAIMGGIPVERMGNTIPAMKRGLACIGEGYTMLVHPEGTRTRDGEMHEFKGGAAKLAIDAGVNIIPVWIDGAWDIFRPGTKLPKIINWRKLSRYKLRISFGEPLSPEGKSVEELTAEVQSAVTRLGAK
jgi:long-chain acyl-CoA synthetase